MLGILLLLPLMACNKQKTYAEQLDEMQRDITSFMANHRFVATDKLPQGCPWVDSEGHELFYQTESGLYIHVADTGRQAGGVKKGQEIAVRYTEMSVRGDTVTYSNMKGSHDPQIINYGTVYTGSGSTYFWGDCQAWHEALDYVGDYGRVKLIVPTDLGMPIYNQSQVQLLAHYYELSFTFWR